MSTWTDLLTRSDSGDHIVQLYGEDDQLLTRNVSRYLAEGMRRSDGLIVIATPAHTQAIARHLAEEGASARGERVQPLLCLPARPVRQRCGQGGPQRDNGVPQACPRRAEDHALEGLRLRLEWPTRDPEAPHRHRWGAFRLAARDS